MLKRAIFQMIDILVLNHLMVNERYVQQETRGHVKLTFLAGTVSAPVCSDTTSQHAIKPILLLRPDPEILGPGSRVSMQLDFSRHLR